MRLMFPVVFRPIKVIYEVCAKNREGEATNTLILNVTAKPKQPKAPVNEPPMIVKQLTPTVCR